MYHIGIRSYKGIGPLLIRVPKVGFGSALGLGFTRTPKCPSIEPLWSLTVVISGRVS